MRKTKIKQRLVNAANAFFADENYGENKLVSFRNETNLWQEGKYEDSARRSSALEAVLKQVLLFFPGTFVLYILSMGFTVAMIGTVAVKKSPIIKPSEFTFFAGVFLAATLMTWLGLGDVRKLKHLVIPVSIISVGVVFGAIIGGLMIVSNYFQTFVHGNAFPFYVFPLALIAPFLAKGWVDKDA